VSFIGMYFPDFGVRLAINYYWRPEIPLRVAAEGGIRAEQEEQYSSGALVPIWGHLVARLEDDPLAAAAPCYPRKMPQNLVGSG